MDGIPIMNEEGWGGNVGSGLGSYHEIDVVGNQQSSPRKVPMGKDIIDLNPFYRSLLLRGIRNYPIIYDDNGVYTYHSEKLHKHLLFANLRKKIEKVCEKWSRGNGEGYVYSMWINVINSNGKILPHHHNPDGASYRITGAYYLSKPKGSGNLIAYNPDKQIVRVETGDIVLFGADMLHETEVNETDKERISFGFNFFQNRSD